MSVTVETHIDIESNLDKVRDKEFWLFAANEWWRLVTPYVPMDSGALATTTDIEVPKGEKLSESVIESIAKSSGNIKGKEGYAEIEYISPYAEPMYENDYNFRTDKHPLASSQWDKAAEPQQKPKLIGAMQDYVDSGRLNLK